MAVRRIDTEITISNEQEFRRQMRQVNNSLAGLKSQMGVVATEFDKQANSTEALRKKQTILQQQYDQQREKVRALAQMLESAKSVYDDNSDVVTRYQKQLDNATVSLIKFGRELEDTNKYLDEAKRSADGTASSIDEFGKAVKDAGKEGSSGLGQLQQAFGQLGEAAKSGDINGMVTALGSLKGALIGGAAIAGAKALADGIINITESTKEYRTILGTLEVSSKQAGYTQEQTTEIYKKFQAVLGDTQKAATATANLQALKLSQENLRVVMEEAIGAWATYGDSIPIDSLSESINETVQAGKVTGVFADALNWAGTSEDDFNERLAACATTADRANLVMSQLASQGLQATGQAWVENNQDIVAANEAQEKMNESLSRLGEALQPTANALLEFGAGAIDICASVVEAITTVINAFGDLSVASLNALSSSFAAVDSQYNLADYQANGLVNAGGEIDYAAAKRMQDAGTFKRASKLTPSEARQRGWNTTYLGDLAFGDNDLMWQVIKKINGSHASGLDYVPFDGYVAELHRGEAVLTSSEAGTLRALGASTRALGGRGQSGASGAVGSTGSGNGQPTVTELTIPVELTIDGATFARKTYKYRIAEDNRRGTPLAGKGGR